MMDEIGNIIRDTAGWYGNDPHAAQIAIEPMPVCEVCDGFGVVKAHCPGHSKHGQTIDCPAPNCVAAHKRRENRLRRLFGFTPSESANELREFTFESFLKLPTRFLRGKGHAYAAARLFADAGARGFSLADAAALIDEVDHRQEVHQWLTLTGPNGTGKTSLAAAVVNRVHDKGGEAMYIRWDELYSKIKDTYGDSDQFTESYVLGQVCNIKLLVLDEITVAGITDNMRRVMEFVVRHRAVDRMPTMFTTNWSEDEIDKYWGARIATIIKANHIIGVGGLSLRADNRTVWGFSNGE